MTRLVIARHGNTFEAGEPARRIGARTDLPLTAAGLEQARALRQHFLANGVRFDRILSSALQRTRQTAEAIAGDTGPGIETASFLTEIDHGPDEGQTEADVVARLGNEAITLWDREWVAPEGWEVGAQWRVPAWREFVERVAEELPEGTILLVTSNGAARFALAALGLKPGESRATVKFRTGSYGVIEVLGGADFRLVGWDMRPGETPGDVGLF
jgi:probable phosphoglycerate mutase